MVQLHGKKWTRTQLGKYLGAPWQAGGIRSLRFVGGPEDGVEVIQFDTGTGLVFNALPSRGLDIASAKYAGASLSFDLPSGEAHPAYFDSDGLGWLKTFFGGLVTTCGLTWAGAPCVDQETPLGLHGRYSHLPARHLQIGDAWEGNERRLWISGEMRECILFGPNVVCCRTLSTWVGSNTIRIEDSIRNEAYTRTPHMFLYHINLGYPVLDEHTELLINSRVTPRDDHAAVGLTECRRFETPKVGYQEKVYYHDVKADKNGFCHAALVNAKFNRGQGLGVLVSFRKKELFRFTQWKMMGAGEYVCGLEPCNCSVEGRDKDRREGKLPFLEPGEERNYLIEISVLPDQKAIRAAHKLIG